MFAANVEHSEELAATFRGAGYTAESVTGETPSEKRKQILEDFKTGKVQVVTNVGVLTEGYDNENIKAVLFARPTKSASLYIQMAGR